MIVLDENLLVLRADRGILKWYQGRVCYITALRLGTNIKDEAIPMLLQQAKGATFVTSNVSDFWKRITPHPRYCIICFHLPNERLYKLPILLQKLFRFPYFKAKKSRLGKIIRVSTRNIQYYTRYKGPIFTLTWH